MDEDKDRFVVRKGDRVLIGLLAPFGAATFAVLGMILRERLDAQKEYEKVVKEIIVEFFFTMALFMMLLLVRCLFEPLWLERLLASTSKKIFLVVVVLAVAFVLVFILDKVR